MDESGRLSNMWTDQVLSLEEKITGDLQEFQLTMKNKSEEDVDYSGGWIFDEEGRILPMGHFDDLQLGVTNEFVDEKKKRKVEVLMEKRSDSVFGLSIVMREHKVENHMLKRLKKISRFVNTDTLRYNGSKRLMAFGPLRI